MLKDFEGIYLKVLNINSELWEMEFWKVRYDPYIKKYSPKVFWLKLTVNV